MERFKGACTALILALAVSAGGCAKILNPYEENFVCRAPGDDGRCLDTPTAYQEAITANSFDDPVTPPPANDSASENQASAPAKTPRQEAQAIRYRLLSDLLNEPQTPLLEPPKVLRVLLLPYRGSDDELFMARHVFIKVEEASWVLTDLIEKAR
ncbi:TraV family lipoprotein [Desulfurivibrio sp. D14AmB]|uniref:TraV family lipoprotein n=1 Tax=Desulfurivibrio sp. D14AmB TaxID=3374370 RepID=UPI00376F2FED